MGKSSLVKAVPEDVRDLKLVEIDRDDTRLLPRGSRSGRVAWQYLQDLAGRLGQSLS